MYTGKERRQYTRYSAGNMSASILIQDENGRQSFERVKAVDFNTIGMSIETNLELRIDSKIIINVSKGKNSLSDLICIVCYVEDQEHNNRYGLQFDFGANEYMCSEKVEEVLESMEKQMRKNQNSPYRAAYRRIKSRGR